MKASPCNCLTNLMSIVVHFFQNVLFEPTWNLYAKSVFTPISGCTQYALYFPWHYSFEYACLFLLTTQAKIWFPLWNCTCPITLQLGYLATLYAILTLTSPFFLFPYLEGCHQLLQPEYSHQLHLLWKTTRLSTNTKCSLYKTSLQCMNTHFKG